MALISEVYNNTLWIKHGDILLIFHDIVTVDETVIGEMMNVHNKRIMLGVMSRQTRTPFPRMHHKL